MGMPNRVYLLREINCYVGKQKLPDRWLLSLGLIRAARVESFNSVWIANEPLDPYKLSSDDYETKFLKLSGPLPIEEADQLLKRLRTMLEMAGLEVIEEIVADD
jgi:hypothetical protein